jgi:hypothetical protein
MRPFTLGVTTLVQGLYAFVWLVILFDVASPTFNVDTFPAWTGLQTATAAVESDGPQTVRRTRFGRIFSEWLELR